MLLISTSLGSRCRAGQNGGQDGGLREQRETVGGETVVQCLEGQRLVLLGLAWVKGGKGGVLQGGEHGDGGGEDGHPGEGRCEQGLGEGGTGADGGVGGHHHLT